VSCVRACGQPRHHVAEWHTSEDDAAVCTQTYCDRGRTPFAFNGRADGDVNIALVYYATGGLRVPATSLTEVHAQQCCVPPHSAMACVSRRLAARVLGDACRASRTTSCAWPCASEAHSEQDGDLRRRCDAVTCLRLVSQGRLWRNKHRRCTADLVFNLVSLFNRDLKRPDFEPVLWLPKDAPTMYVR
jgi:hypothetical protein